MGTTDRATVVGGAAGRAGWRSLAAGPGEPRVVRSDLLPPGKAPPPLWGAQPLLSIAHLSDLHVCDSQSPARVEFLDRWADDDSPTKPALVQRDGTGLLSTYRAQDLLTVQVADAAVRAVNAVPAGPVSGGVIDLAVVTGDVTDNAQSNELGWYLALLEGGRIVPDSGDPGRYEGVADQVAWHEAYWHPDPSTPADRPRRLHGFPDAPGLLDVVRRPFDAPGLAVPWLAVHGNHDNALQGTVPATGPLARAATSSVKAVDVPPGWSIEEVLRFVVDLDECRTDALLAWPRLVQRRITPDPARRSVTRAEFVAAHWGPRARPPGHGLPRGPEARAHYRHDAGRVTVLGLDTVNEHGGWQGSLDPGQLDWLVEELTEADREQRYVVLASHHPLPTLVNATTVPGAPARVLRDDVAAALVGHPSLVLWLAGHTHAARVTPHPGGYPWWEVTTPSLIDHPQQGRIVELLRCADGSLAIAATMLDHEGELPWSGGVDSPVAMAGLSRELAANDWQRRAHPLDDQPAAGTPGDRNVVLWLPDPFARRPASAGTTRGVWPSSP